MNISRITKAKKATTRRTRRTIRRRGIGRQTEIVFMANIYLTAF